MTKPARKNLLIILLLILMGAGLIGYFFRHKIYRYIQSSYRSYRNNYGLTDNCPNCASYFPDVVAVMDRAYRKERLKPQNSLTDLERLYRSGVLVKIPSDKRYIVDDMTHSVPYILPAVIPFLAELANEYERELQEKKLPIVPFIIISATRSIESAKQLNEENEIAREKSHHLYGKTLDISYKRFGNKYAQQICLIEALHTLRQRGSCYVKFERKGSLHLTAR